MGADNSKAASANDGTPFDPPWGCGGTAYSRASDNEASPKKSLLEKPDDEILWTEDKAERLQAAVNDVFPLNDDISQVSKFAFSVALADPQKEDYPLIGCSSGFCKLTGYPLEDVMDRNCRFLVENVPLELQNSEVRRRAREFCHAAGRGCDFKDVGDEQQWKEARFPGVKAHDFGVFCVQVNARKDGTLFNNMFFLKKVLLGERPIIVALQTEVDGEVDEDTALEDEALQEACRRLDRNLAEVERALAASFWYTGPMRRQESDDLNDGYVP